MAGAALVVASCGGGGGSAQSALSHRQLVARADAACREANGRIASLHAPDNLSSLAGYASGTRAATVRLRRQIGALRAPQAERAAVERYLEALDRGNALLQEISKAAAAGDQSEVGVLSGRLADTRAGPLAKRAGFSSCANGSASAA